MGLAACLVLLAADRPALSGVPGPRWTPEELIRGLERTIALGKTDDLALFFRPEAVREVKLGRRLQNLHWKDEDWREAIAKSETHAEPLWLNGDDLVVADVGLTLYRGGVFESGYFARHGLARPNSTAALVTGQPWLRWVAADRRFVVERGGAQGALLERLAADGSEARPWIRIFRGMTRPFDLTLWEVTRELSREGVVAANRRAVLAGRLRQAVQAWDGASEGMLPPSGKGTLLALAERLDGSEPTREIGAEIVSAVVEVNSRTGRDAVFMTLSVEKARAFGRHGVVAVELPLVLLAELSQRAEVYIGTEGDVEIAFVSRRSQELLMTGWTLMAAPRE